MWKRLPNQLFATVIKEPNNMMKIGLRIWAKTVPKTAMANANATICHFRSRTSAYFIAINGPKGFRIAIQNVYSSEWTNGTPC